MVQTLFCCLNYCVPGTPDSQVLLSLQSSHLDHTCHLLFLDNLPAVILGYSRSSFSTFRFTFVSVPFLVTFRLSRCSRSTITCFRFCFEFRKRCIPGIYFLFLFLAHFVMFDHFSFLYIISLVFCCFSNIFRVSRNVFLLFAPDITYVDTPSYMHLSASAQITQTHQAPELACFVVDLYSNLSKAQSAQHERTKHVVRADHSAATKPKTDRFGQTHRVV